LPIQYGDFACWEHERLGGEVSRTRWPIGGSNWEDLTRCSDGPPAGCVRRCRHTAARCSPSPFRENCSGS
jgi:hypothetical protein